MSKWVYVVFSFTLIDLLALFKRTRNYYGLFNNSPTLATAKRTNCDFASQTK